MKIHIIIILIIQLKNQTAVERTAPFVELWRFNPYTLQHNKLKIHLQILLIYIAETKTRFMAMKKEIKAKILLPFLSLSLSFLLLCFFNILENFSLFNSFSVDDEN